MRLAAVAMVRNEADIIESFVRHTLRFADELRLIDHLSTDRTPEILKRIQAEGLPLRVTRHNDNAQIQEILTTRLAREAFAAKADWVIPLDCDEFIDAPGPEGLREALTAAQNAQVAWWPWISMVPLAEDDAEEIDPVKRIGHRLAREGLVTPKCVFHRSLGTRADWQLAPGNHHVRLSDRTPLPMQRLPEACALRHYPVRSLDQLTSKMVLGRMAWLPRLRKGSNIAFQTREFVERLKTGWVPTRADLTAYASRYQDPGQAGTDALVYDPLPLAHALRYTGASEAAFLPRMIDWAERLVTTEPRRAPPAIFKAPPKPSPEPARPPRAIAPAAAAAFNAANAAWRAGRLADVVSGIDLALQSAPDLPEAHVLKARALRRMGDEMGARVAYDAAVTLEPASFDARLERGNVLRSLGTLDEAAADYAAAMKTRPLDPRPALALARLWDDQPGPEAAERAAIAFQRALDRAGSGPDPAGKMAEICHDMARFRMERADLPRALDALRHARLLATEDDQVARIDLDLAETCLRLGLSVEGECLMERLSASEDADLLCALADLAYRFNYWAEAVAILTRRATLHTDDGQAHLDLADMQVKSWLLEEALASLDKAEATGTVPPSASAALRASAANRSGDADTALTLYEGLVAEGQSSFASNAAMSLLYTDSVSPDEVAHRHRALFADWGRGARTSASFKRDPTPDTPLRIGMVTGDLHHQHPVNIFMQPLLARWDQAALPLTIYNTGQTVDDQTRLARSRVGTWRDVTTAQLPARVEADRIDILIDLAGHTCGRTMRAFARRMAPVQASFLGYPGSTGVPNIDWLIGDPIVTPPEDDHLCSERVIRLPNTVFCFAPEVEYPLPDFLAMPQDRPLTFGSFNNIPKLTHYTIRLWADVLKAVPDARLLLRAPSFNDAGAIDRYRRLFGERGIVSDRLIFKGPVALDDMMRAYSEIDIALDPTPYCGGTTTLQALWMGVPVLTLKGGHFVSRMGASFMTAAGLSDWIAACNDDYVAKARRFASDRPLLMSLKIGLRSKLLERPAWNADLYARDFQNALLSAWKMAWEKTDAR